jgi:SAM-dependent methyltransferase
VTTPLSFDRAADFYDQTRGFPPGIADKVAASALEAIPSGSRILEIGVGTGRIGIPLLRRGARLVGLDVSRKMMQRLRENLDPAGPPAPLVEGNALHLPFPAGSFGGVIVVHVLHLIPERQQALDEVIRLLQPGGVFLSGFNWEPEGSAPNLVRAAWQRIVEQYPEARQSAHQRNFHLPVAELEGRGGVHRQWDAAAWPSQYIPAERIGQMEQGMFSSTWRLPDEVRGRSLSELRRWAAGAFGDLHVPIPVQRKFVWQSFTF